MTTTQQFQLESLLLSHFHWFARRPPGPWTPLRNGRQCIKVLHVSHMHPSAQSLAFLEDSMALSHTHCSTNHVYQCLPKWQKRTTQQNNNCVTFCWVSRTCCNRYACTAHTSQLAMAVERQEWCQEARRLLEGSFLSSSEPCWNNILYLTRCHFNHSLYLINQ